MPCKHASSGCNHPEGECLGLCLHTEDPAEVLRKHNDWRRAEVLTPAPHDSETVSIAISMVLAELHLLRKRVKVMA